MQVVQDDKSDPIDFGNIDPGFLILHIGIPTLHEDFFKNFYQWKHFKVG